MKKFSPSKKLLILVTLVAISVGGISLSFSYFILSKNLNSEFEQEADTLLNEFKFGLETYFKNNISVLSEIASDPNLISLVVQNDSNKSLVLDTLRSKKMINKVPEYSLYDFEGNKLLSTNDEIKGNISLQQIQELIDGKVNYLTKLFILENKRFICFAVPVKLRGENEGVLISELELSLENIFTHYKNKKNSYFEIVSNEKSFEKVGVNKEISESFSATAFLLNPDIRLNYVRDASVVNETVNELAFELLSVLLISVFIILLIFSRFGEEYIVKPSLELLKKTKESQELFNKQSLLMDTFTMGMWEIDLAKGNFEWSDAVYSLFSIPKGEFDNKVSSFVNLVHQNDREFIRKTFEECLKNQSDLDISFQLAHAQKQVFLKGKGTFQKTYDEETGQEKIKVLGFFWDITNEKVLEIQNSHQAKLASVGELAAGVGHEINNPLAIANGYLHQIKKAVNEYPGELANNTDDFFQKVDFALSRVANIVKSLRTFSRNDTERKEVFSVVDAVNESFQMVKEIYKLENLNVHFRSDLTPQEEGEFLLYGNNGKIQQICMNLMTNARDAVRTVQSKTIEITIRKNNRGYYISFKDNGVGIPNDIQDKIFNPFFTTKDVNKGTGIGLSLSYRFMEEVGGEISFKSEIEKGTEFYLVFPFSSLVNKDGDKQMTNDNSGDVNLLKGKILLADDEEDLRDVFMIFLEEFGLDVVAVENGRVALDKLSAHNDYDLLITDIQMPEMTGLELIEEMSKLDNMPPALIISGAVENDDHIENLISSGKLAGTLNKPFENDEIYRVISQIIKA